MSSTRNLRKSVLSIAMGLCLTSLAASPVFAQSATGAVAGRASAGDQVVLVNNATGASRTVTVNSDGSYRVSQLPVGDYSLQVKRGGQDVGQSLSVNVSLGGTTTVNLGNEGNLTNIDAVQVVGSRVVNRVDVYSTETATNVTREELSRMPVDQSIGAVALLAPGVVASGATFGGLTFGGSSVAENAAYINGLNVTDPYRRQGFSSVPFAFYQEFQVKTGGYSAEFGRSTGGVINAVTRSGGNDFKAGMEVTLEPADWAAERKDHFHSDGTLDERNRTSRDTNPLFKTNVWASGPIVQDKLFFFAMYEKRDNNSKDYDATGAWLTRRGNGFWGGKLDWHINDDHLLELLAFSDKADSATDVYRYTWETETLDSLKGDSIANSGGKNWSLTYTGHFTDNFTAKAMYGVNKRSAANSSTQDADCSIVTRSSTYTAKFGAETTPEGCHPTESSIGTRFDRREAARLDFEWALGDHLLRFGVDREVMDSSSSVRYPGDGRSYQVQGATAGSALNGTVIPAGTTAIVDARRYLTGTPVTTEAEALYLEDNWNVTPNLLLSLGLRADKFHNKYASGVTFAKADFSDMLSPRLGFSWDVMGDGSTKVFGNAGRYYLPLTNKLPDYFAGTTDEHTYYVLDGWQQMQHPVAGTYLLPILGAQIGGINTNGNVPAPQDFRTAVARDLKMVFQDEFILGFQRAINPAWSYGVNATYRRMTRSVEDVRINHVEGCPWYSGDWPIINPGETNTLWCPTTNDWVTFDSSEDGYKALGSGAIMGYKKPKRTYKAVEFQLDRAWDDKWAFNASYLWSRSEGNIEGPVNSDTGYADTNLVQYYDHPAVNERYGVLFNDFRHQIKLRGSFKLNDMWSFGATLSARSGGPITAFGVVWPNDNRAAGGSGEFSGGGSGWLCEQSASNDCSKWATRQLTYSERGAFGRMPWVTDLNANVTWTLPVEGVDLKARFSVYNLLNNQTAINVHSRHESTPGVVMPYFGQATVWQSPRYMNLVVTYNF
ncbi:TonB-dependent receptor [Thermomonas fusca]|uniref:TonB-dependent receptor n=1 Tax=Thermomonas fusca TaxID=215690 RepID=A0A5R9PF48_9GAMM|nr:TonB-dependent receptor [Thermomonas fusca]TLX22105.1 TonB-dependent receptor [Thermomonas fusca]